MISTVFLKSTVRPWPSVRRPSSSTCSRTLKTSAWAFSISSSRTTRVGPAADRLGELAALVVADVAGRRADEPRDGVLLHVLRHVDADHRVLGVEHELGERAGELGLADAGRAEEQERADRPVRVAEPGARAAQRVGDGLDRLVLADDALVQALLHVDELLHLGLEQAGDRDAGPAADDLGDLVGVDALGQVDGRLASSATRAPRPRRAALELGDLAVAQLGGALRSRPRARRARARRAPRRGAPARSPCPSARSFSRSHWRAHAGGSCSRQLGELALDLLAALGRRVVLLDGDAARSRAG